MGITLGRKKRGSAACTSIGCHSSRSDLGKLDVGTIDTHLGDRFGGKVIALKARSFLGFSHGGSAGG